MQDLPHLYIFMQFENLFDESDAVPAENLLHTKQWEESFSAQAD